MICPRCHEPLARYRSYAGLVWQCNRCGGRAVALSVLRKAVEAGVVRTLWVAATQGGVRSKLLCPSCRKAMSQASVGASVPVTIEVCELCQFVWADAGELEQMPAAPPPVKPQEPELPPEAREALAMAKVESLSRRAKSAVYRDDLPESPLDAAMALLGLPVEHENPLQNRPWITWLTAFTVAVISLMSFWHTERAMSTLALVPSEWWRYGGINLLTNFFVHGSLFHLVGNLYFLVIFGDNVEDRIGHIRFVLLLIMATLAGNIVHILFDPRSNIPCIGASGGIFGLVAFYTLAFPYARFYVAFRFWIYTVPVWELALVWLFFQLIGAFVQVTGTGYVSSLAHLGGALAGLVCWVLWRRSESVVYSS
ncbi:MAG: rhomboid family intramembrane serine protease [Armatimonadota bacterium]|nr:rhomboid family intramembrane serine protease [Armatimonadota bacterium]